MACKVSLATSNGSRSYKAFDGATKPIVSPGLSRGARKAGVAGAAWADMDKPEPPTHPMLQAKPALSRRLRNKACSHDTLHLPSNLFPIAMIKVPPFGIDAAVSAFSHRGIQSMTSAQMICRE